MKPKQPQIRRRGRPAAAADGAMRERLLSAATELFAERGIAATSMAEIAAHVGVTSAMLHYYFNRASGCST